MKAPIRQKLPIRSMFKNLFSGNAAQETAQPPSTYTVENGSNLPTPQPITTDTSHTTINNHSEIVDNLISVETDDAPSAYHIEPHVEESVVELDSETWATQEYQIAESSTTEKTETEEQTSSITATPTSDTQRQYLGLHRVLREQLSKTPEYHALAYVNITTNQLLAFETTQLWAEAAEPFIASAITDLFLAPNVVRMIGLFQELRDKPLEEVNYYQITLSAKGVHYVLLRATQRADRVAVFACRDVVSFGLVLHQAHHTLPYIEAAEDLLE